jgi:hypothetical protein
MTHPDFDAYLALLVRLMPVDAREREAIREELRSHLEDRFDELISKKIPPDEALRRAIDDLGDAARLAAAFVSLTRIQRRRQIMRFSSATLVVAVLALLGLFAFWPTDPGGNATVLVTAIAPSTAQAQDPTAPQPKTRQAKSAIAEKLSKPIDAEFVETPLNDVLKYLADSLDVQFHVNRRAIEESGVTLDSPVTINLKNIKASTLLGLLLDSVAGGLDFVERDGFILVSTIDDLDHMTEVRVYNCRDLLALAPPGLDGAASPAMYGGPTEGYGVAGTPPGMPGGPASGGFGGSPAPRPGLPGLIQTAVESGSWEDVGGVGSISEFNGLLVIKQSARVHEKIDELLAMLRQAADLESDKR